MWQPLLVGTLALIVAPPHVAHPAFVRRSAVAMDGTSLVDVQLEKLFAYYDADSDGGLTREEKLRADSSLVKAIGRSGGQMRTDKFDEMDADASGDVDCAEFVASWKAKYAAYPASMQTAMLGRIEELIE
jgi:hypothetical protein